MYRIEVYIYYNNCDYYLFDRVTEDFLGWIEDTFKMASADLNRRFRDILRNRGIYVPINKKKIAGELAGTISLETMPEWPLSELEKEQERRKMNSQLNLTSQQYANFHGLGSETTPETASPYVDPDNEPTPQAPRLGHSR